MIDKERLKDYQIVREMLVKAQAECLETEVVLRLIDYRLAAYTMESAATMALHDWIIE